MVTTAASAAERCKEEPCLPAINNSYLFQPKRVAASARSRDGCGPHRSPSPTRDDVGKVSMSGFVFIATLLFSLLTFVSLCIDIPPEYELQVELVELTLLVIFLVEFALKLYSLGLVTTTQNFVKSVGNNCDIALITLTFVLASFSLAESTLWLVKSRVALRLLRLTVAFRRLDGFKRSPLHAQHASSRQVVKVLQNLMREPWLSSDRYEQIAWCIDMISSNRLNEPIAVREEPSTSVSLSVETSPEVTQCLSNVDSLDFDVFELKKLTSDNELLALMHKLFTRKGLLEDLEIDAFKFKDFVSRIQRGYNKVPYHSATHAADVTQTLHYLLTTCGAGDLLAVDALETAACYLASCVHDFGHPGVSNNFLVRTSAEIALRYNDKSVLENYHVASSFHIAASEQYNIYAELSQSDFKRIRNLMIDMVLATNNASHFSAVAEFQRQTSEPDPKSNKNLWFQMLLHAADLSNPCKTWTLYERWAKLVMEEFWAEGDREREEGLPVTPVFDRQAADIAKHSLGYITFIVEPTYEVLKKQLPALQECCKNLKENQERLRQSQLN